jgi:uncharacterized membrane protein
MKKELIWESNHLGRSQISYLKHLYLGLYLSLLSLAVFIIGIIHSFIPNLFPFVPILLINKIKEIFGNNYNVNLTRYVNESRR